MPNYDIIPKPETTTGAQAKVDAHTRATNPHTVYALHTLSTAINDFLVGSGSNTFVKKTLSETLVILGKAVASGLASLDASSLVVQNPANATATPTASKIPIADGSAKLDGWVTISGASSVQQYARRWSLITGG